VAEAGRIRVNVMEEYFVRTLSMEADFVQSLTSRLRAAIGEAAKRH